MLLYLKVLLYLDLEQGTVSSKLPAYKEACLSALAISPDQSLCLIAYTNQRIMEIDLSTARSELGSPIH